MFLPILFRFAENTAFPARLELERILGTFAPDLVLPYVFPILNANRAKYPHIVRISALKILCRLRQPYCLQRILESLPTMTQDEAGEFASLIAEYPKDMFNEKATALFALPDAKIRAALINILPVTKNDTFKKEIRFSLKDVDPDVRAASIKALLGFDELRLINQETSMLHDPVERVRLAAAEVISIHGNPAAMKILENIVNDPNETDVVKEAVIAGLGQAENEESVSILISVLDKQNEFRKQAEKALAQRTVKRDIIQLLEIFKDAEPQLREKLIPVFRAQGRKAEPYILEILKDEIASLKPYLVTILEETGYVDELKRRLSNREAAVRREAALMLSLLDTLPAFRGLVLAAKDPDQEVRVCVVRALEKLNSSQSHDILESLKKDPDNRIRKYTHWALERLDTLGME
jgi:HEAT repeat protein